MFGYEWIADANADGKLKVALTDTGSTVDVFCASFGGSRGGIVLLPKVSNVQVTPRSSRISSAKFHYSTSRTLPGLTIIF